MLHKKIIVKKYICAYQKGKALTSENWDGSEQLWLDREQEGCETQNQY